MQQQELERELAQLTGESLGLIRQRGFSLVLSEAQLFERELESTLPHTIDRDTTA